MTAARPKKTITAKEPYLKGKNAAYLWLFIAINIAVFLCLFVGSSLTEASIDHFWHRVTMKSGIIAAGIPIVSIVLAGVLSDTAKARLVFWRWRYPLPGCRVFTELLKTDPRLDVPTLKKKLGNLPSEPQAQNALWFSSYRRHSAAPRVLEAQRLYLLTRDMTAMTALFAVLLSVGVLVGTAGWKVFAMYAIALLAQYLLIASSARNYGCRFVLNVLSEELTQR